MLLDSLDFYEIVFLIFASSAGVLLIYAYLFFGRLAFRRKKTITAPVRPISVVVCARNEAYNLKINLPFILQQNHPDFEVIVVNDASEDETMEVLLGLSSIYTNLKIVNIPKNVNFFKGKKFPLSIGLKEASHEWVVCTDADCIPKTMDWLGGFQELMADKADIIIGYGAYERRRGLLNMLVRFETLITGMMSFGFALSGMPYMGVGRNIAYRRSFFFKRKALVSHYTVASGDDDIFVNRNAGRKNTKVRPEAEYQTISRPPSSFMEWAIQKKRHYSASSRYKKLSLLIPGLYFFAQVTFYVSFALLAIAWYEPEIVFSVFGFRLISQLFLTKKCMQRLGEKNLLLLSPLFEIFLLVFSFVLWFSNVFFRKNKWK